MIRKGKTMTEKETIQITPSLLHSTKSVLRNWCSAWIVLMVGLMITAAVVLYMKSSVERIAELEFISQCNEISNKISDRLYDHSLLLLSGAALFKASETFTREEWHIFTRHQKIEKTLPGIQGIGFSLLIPPKELTRHIQKIRREGFSHYKLRPDGDRKVYSSIIYLEPFSGRNLQAFGYDMLSEPVRRSAMERARDTGAAALSGKVILVQETDEAVQAGTLMYMPVYRNDMPIETVEQRRAAIYGWVYSPYRMNDLIHGIFGDLNQKKEKQMHLQVFDGAQPSPESLLYDSYSTGDKKFRPDARFTRQVPVDFNGQLWTLRFTRTGGGFFTVDYISVWITLVSGIFITLLLFTLTIALLSTVAKKRIAANLTAELRESEEKYRNLFENANEAIFVVQDGKLVFLNPMTAMITGYSAEELMAKPFAEFIHPDDLDMVIDRHIRRMKGEELPHVYSFRIIHKDGNIIWGESNAVLISWNGETATLNFLSDITDRKQAGDLIIRQNKLLAAINRVFFETMMEEREETVAKTFLKVAQEITDSKFGLIGEITPEGLFTTIALSDPGWEACRIPETEASVMIKNMVIRGILGQAILKEQALIVNDPVSYPDRVGIPEGHPPLTSFLGVPLKDQDKVIGMIAMANRVSGYTADHQQDIEALCVVFVQATLRKKAEGEIKKLNAELEQRVNDRTAQLEAANKELVAFSYSVSHDLRAPLRSIDGFSQVLLEKYGNNLDEKGKTYLDRVRRATQHMGRLIDDMLKLSRITQAEFKRQNVNMSDIIREITKTYKRDNPDRAVDVTIQDGVIIQGDPYLMHIAMENLVGNAFKFTGMKEHPQIEFGTTVRDGETACFIRDNGAGFDMAYGNKLFGAFQRLHTTSEFPGTGIGLATVKRIIHRHEGRIWAEGEVGKGATFYFTVPS